MPFGAERHLECRSAVVRYYQGTYDAFWDLRQKPDGSHLAQIGARAYIQMRGGPKNKKIKRICQA